MRNPATIAGNDTRIVLGPDIGLTVWQRPNGNHVIARWVGGRSVWVLDLTPAQTRTLIAALQQERPNAR